MKSIVFLMLFASLALATCSDQLTTLEKEYQSYLGLVSIECSVQNTKEIYSNLAALGEGYKVIAECFKEAGEPGKASAYFSLAGEKYKLTADALCTDYDYGLKTQLYLSAGDAYKNAGQPQLARVQYDSAVSTYQTHTDAVDAGLYGIAQQKLYELDHPVGNTFQTVGDTSSMNWLPIAVAALVFFGIGIVVFSLGKK